ncbi:hypothetical protein JS44_03405 [Anoxybacillus flavithermus]|uniref:Phage ABA sandwich domain-containing protein n=1 Tax=Anoxybacillus flavithermus TaxID=33934 RepID=A0A094IXU9_9BACL|nr:hypothetical protein JS44_03405 [Anoxybacillus flavithermus]
MGWEPVYDDGDLISFVTEFGTLFFSDDDESEWSPTIDIADAWQVVEKLREQDIFTDIRMNSDGKYEVSMYELYDQDFEWLAIRVSDRNVSLAICLAALKAVGVEVEVNEQ